MMNSKPKQAQENSFILFTACRFDPRLKIGAGCSLVLPAQECVAIESRDAQFGRLYITKDFKDITATGLELETMIWALENYRVGSGTQKLIVCCDFKFAKNLLEKRIKLEQTNYAGTLPGTTIANADLYQKIYKLHDRLNFELCWMEVPVSETEKDSLQIIFAKVVQKADQALKDQLKDQNQIADKWF